MFGIVVFVLFGLTLAGFPSDDYDYEVQSLMRYSTQDAAASEALLRRIRGNIMKLFAGREVPSDLTDLTMAVRAEGSTAPYKRTSSAAAVEEATMSDNPTVYVLQRRLGASGEYETNKELLRGEDTTEAATTIAEAAATITEAATATAGAATNTAEPAATITEAATTTAEAATTITEAVTNTAEAATNITEAVTNTAETATNITEAATNITEADTTTAEAATTTTETAIPTNVNCTDEAGYRIRCKNKTVGTTTKPTPTTTRTKLPIAEEDQINENDTETVQAEKKARIEAKEKKYDEELKLKQEKEEREAPKRKEEERKRSSEEFIRTSEAVDIDKLLKILNNLTYIYDTDLVMKMNETLGGEGYPYCPSTFSTTTETTVATTLAYGVANNLTGVTTNRCYVCGLESEGVPKDAKCADAFASDFFPTAPVDFTARSQMERYKKHCKYIDRPSWYLNGSRDRLMWGAWSGGCSVRWLDLSGIYTQRACRNRHRPALGRHYASKRMAKLEYALNKEENACIISPQASLVPFSRGVSLYARFHACVCTGNYCNPAKRLLPLHVWPTFVYAVAVREFFLV